MTQFMKRFDIRISVFYAIIATLWILFSDTLAVLLFGNNEHLDDIFGTLKGLVFVAVTALALYLILSTERRKRAGIERELELERDISPIAILIFDMNGCISYINMQAEKILGVPRAEIIGQPYNAPAWHVTDYDGNPIDAHYPDMSKMIEARQTIFGIQQAIEVVKGKRILLEINLAPIINSAGALTGAVATFTDVTNATAQEKRLRESEIRYRMLIEQASDAILIVKDNGPYIEANSAACKLLGYTREEILQKNMLDLFIITPEKPLRYAELQQGKTLINERELIRKDGSLVSVEVSSKLLLDGTVQAIARDISERKRVEQELRLKSAALDSAANGIMITDASGIIKWINPAFTVLTGYSLDEALDRKPSELVRSGVHDEAFYKDMWDSMLAGKVWHGELINRRKDGSLYDEEETITPLRNESGEITHFIGIKQDITGRKLHEEAIQKLNAELEGRVSERTTQLNHIKNRIESIFNSNADSIVYSHKDGRIEQVNPAFTQTFGYSSDEILRQPLSSLVMSDDASRLELVIENVLERRQAEQIDVIAIRKEGKMFEAAMTLSPVIENSDTIVGVVLSIHNVTSRNHMLRHAMDLSELKSRYVSMAAHDLRNPMAVILTSADTLRYYNDRLTEEKKQIRFDQINASIKVMTDILDDVLVMGQMDSGKLGFRPAPLNMINFCQMLIAEAVQATGTTIQVNFSTEGISDTITMDAKLLRHILGNLLSNAIKYSPVDSAIIFSVRNIDGQLIFHIQDQGIGIPKEDQAQLFETFYRASNAKDIRGTGLGLAIVKQSVELHGGTITFDSEEGQGTTFIVNLPIVA